MMPKSSQIIDQYRYYHVLSNILEIEKLVFSRCVEYIDAHEILIEKQFGFRPNHSTYMVIIQLVDKVFNAVEQNGTTGFF